jgi:hypothetical protein
MDIIVSPKEWAIGRRHPIRLCIGAMRKNLSAAWLSTPNARCKPKTLFQALVNRNRDKDLPIRTFLPFSQEALPGNSCRSHQATAAHTSAIRHSDCDILRPFRDHKRTEDESGHSACAARNSACMLASNLGS